jgi:hypothetical protein
MIHVFDKHYKAISNIFVETHEGHKYTYPAPIDIYATIEDERKNLKNMIEFRVSSYLDSILPLTYNFSIFTYLLTFDYTIDTLYIASLMKTNTSSESYGYKGTFSFSNDNVMMNIGKTEIYDEYDKIKTILQD